MRLSLANLMTFPWIAEPAAAGRLRCKAIGSTSTPACWRASGPTGLSRWSEPRRFQSTGTWASVAGSPAERGFVSGEHANSVASQLVDFSFLF